MGLVQFLLIVVAGFVLFRFFPVFIVWQRIIGRRMNLGPPKMAATSDLPAELSEVYKAAATLLQQQGFVFSHALQRPQAYFDVVNFVQVYFHPGTHAFAYAAPRIVPYYPRPFHIGYLSCFTDGSSATTGDCIGSSLLEVPGRDFVFDGFFGDPDAQWKLHQSSVEGIVRSRNVSVLSLSPEELVVFEERGRKESLAYHAGKSLDREADDFYTIRPRRAWHIAVDSVRMVRKGVKKFGPPPAHPGADEEAQVQADLHILREPRAYRGVSWRIRRRKILLGVGSAALFAAGFGLLYRWETVPLILLVLLLHELGHLTAMKVFHYQDPSMFFVPLVGAVILVDGEQDIPPMKTLLVYLMGPLPGLLIGVVLAAASLIAGQKSLLEAGIMFLVLNYFNLLPVVPLDGGRIVELLVRRRFPRAPMVFGAVSAVVLLLGAVLLQAPVLVWAGVLMIMTVPVTLRLSRSIRLLEPVVAGTKNGDELCRAVVEFTYRNPAWVNKKEGRLTLAKRLRSHFFPAAPTRSEAIKGAALYVLSLASPVLLFVLLFLSRSVLSLFRPGGPEFDWRKELALASTPETRLDAMVHAAKWMEETGEDSAAVYYHRALALSDSIRLIDDRYLTILESLASVEEDSLLARQHLARALVCAERIHGPDHPRIAELLERSAASKTSGLDDSKKIEYLQRAFRIHHGSLEAGGETARLRLASLYMKHDRSGEAETLLRESVETQDTSFLQMFGRMSTAHMLAELYSTTSRGSLGISFLGTWEKRLSERAMSTWGSPLAGLATLELTSHRGWIALRGGDTALARTTFLENLEKAKSVGKSMKSLFPVVDYILDICYLDLLQGRIEDARRNFDWLRAETNVWILEAKREPGYPAEEGNLAEPWEVWKEEPSRGHATVVECFLPEREGAGRSSP